MPRMTRWRRATMLAAAIGLAALPLAATSTPADAADAHALIEGSGSTWAANAVNQWVADTTSNGLQVVFTANGSSQGRKDFANKTVDYAVSDIAYLGTDEQGNSDTANGRNYAYVPITAGGTSFPYHVEVAGQLVKNIRLKPATIAKIFSNQINNWNDPAITADNNGRALPSLTIVPIVRSDGSGATAQFTRYLSKVTPSIWSGYYSPGTQTSYWPAKGPQISQNGSDQVMNYLTSSAANGGIAYDEYSYALQKNYPVIKLENQAGFYTSPTQYNVAVALTKAHIDTTDVNDPTKYLTQNLDDVYTDSDPRAYAMSSYSYMVIPTGTNDQDSRLSTAKRQTIGDFLFYSLCEGQREMGPLGYSPLPINLVQSGFDQVGKLKTADAGVNLDQRDVSQCNNPTFVAGDPNRNYLAEIAPQPQACDQDGVGPCGSSNAAAINANPTGGKAPTSTTAIRGATSTTKGATTTNKSGSGTTTATGPAATGTTAVGTAGTSSGATTTGANGAGSATGATSAGTAAAMVDPETGALVGGGTGASTGGTTTDGSGVAADGSSDPVLPIPTTLASERTGAPTRVLAPLAAVLLLAALIVPVLLGRRLSRRADGTGR